ncbi:helix-turn-helix domain-containing protein [Vagococcus penaei]|uniref:HTH araC/xylS-type domain-containing protein n=1 Tax=Vagococcus penaei TaxID=633807 RepID=A0A1Q2D8F2_9ENTE|nr:helix-turn-helix domain-containing protein [Vagococcus penaei]AQP54698.1 hypothetical protein BW732_11085 [Vagococcus penaei]
MCNILIVSSNMTLKSQLDYLFKKYFVNVFILPQADNSEQAIHICQSTIPEIILYDLSLNDDVFILHDSLTNKFPNLRAIYIDSSENFPNIQKVIRSGGIDYLVEPLNESDTLNSIHRAIISLNHISLLNYQKQSTNSTAHNAVLPLIQFIHKNFQKEISLDELANYMHLNKNYICQLFKKEVGMTFKTYLSNYRVEQAKKLLRETDWALCDISDYIGYADPAYFSRQFKKIEGISPTDYRDYYKKNFALV